MSALVLGEIVGLLLNILTSYDRYPVQDCENLPLRIQVQLSDKRKNFSEFLIAFLEFISNFEHFGRKDYRHS